MRAIHAGAVTDIQLVDGGIPGDWLGERCWFQRVSPPGPKKSARVLLSMPCTSHHVRQEIINNFQSIKPDEPVANKFFIFRAIFRLQVPIMAMPPFRFQIRRRLSNQYFAW